MRRTFSLALIASLIAIAGCEQAQPTATAPPAPPLATIPTPPPPAPVQPAPAPNPMATPAPDTTAAPTPAPMPGVETPPPATDTEEVKAGVGVGKKGRSLDEYEGVVVTPVKSLFAARERVMFEIQIPQALALFNATEGRFPKSHEEFMEKIVAANNLQLPELPEGHRYKWDPEKVELMVERPVKK